MKTIIILKRLLAVSFTLLALMLVTKSAQATHFRYATISWEIPNPAQPRTVNFRIESAWRRSYFGTPAVGATIVPAGSFPATITIQALSGPAYNHSLPMNAVVNAVNSTEDWLVAVTQSTHTFPPDLARTYPVGFTNCCRISTLLNGNNDVEFRVHTDVVIDQDNPILQSPRATLLPVIYLQQNAAAILPLPSIDGSDGSSTFSFAT